MRRNFIKYGIAWMAKMIVNNIESFFKKIHRKDVAITERLLGKSIFHSAFWARKRLDSAIRSASSLGKGRMLDVGCGLRPYERYFKDRVNEYIGLDHSPGSGYLGNKANIFGDIKKLPFKANSFDTILFTEVLEHIDSPDSAIDELSRVINEDGRIIVTSPFVYPLHGAKIDYFRFTEKGLISLLERHNFQILSSKIILGSAMTLAMLINIYLYEECFLWNRIFYPLSILIRPLILLMIFFVNIIGWILEKIIKLEPSLPFNHLIIAKINDGFEKSKPL